MCARVLAVGCQVGTVLLMALTCEIEEHEFLLMLHNGEVRDLSYITQSSQEGKNTNVT